jgi:hypothetical protein
MAARDGKIERTDARSVVRKMGMSEDYEGRATPIRSYIATFFERHRYLRAALCTGRMFDSLHQLRMTIKPLCFEILVKIAASREDPEV